MSDNSDQRESQSEEEGEQSESGEGEEEGENDIEKEEINKKGANQDEYDEQYENICLMFPQFERDTIKEFYMPKINNSKYLYKNLYF